MAIDKFSVTPGSLPILRHSFTSSGTLTVPAGINYMYILAAGGGGNQGAGSNEGIYGNFSPGNAAGGSGGVAQGWVRTIPGETLTYAIGAATGSTTVSTAGEFPFSFVGGGGASGAGNTSGAAGTTSSTQQALQFVNAGLGTLPTTTITLGTAPHYSGAGGSGVGLSGGGGAGNAVGGRGLSGLPNSTGGSGITEISNTGAGGVGGGGGGGVYNGGPQNPGGAGAVRIYY
jgi:hypothetical protein